MSRHFASTDAQSYMRTLERRVGQLERRGRNMSAISASLHAGRLGDALPDCVTMITPSDTPPPDPVGDVCDIWIDTSANPPIPRMWDGEDWLKITDQDLLDALRKITHPIGIEGGEEMPPYDPNRRVGALWRDPKTGVLYYWDGHKWVRVTVGDVGHDEKVRQDIEEARQEIADTGAELDEKLRQAQEDLEAASGRIDDAEDRLGAAEAELEDAAIWIAETGLELGVRLAQAEQDLLDAEARLEGAETRLSNAEGEIADASAWIDETGAELGTNLAQAQQDIDAAEVRLTAAEGRLTTAEGEIADASDWIADTGAQLGTNLAAAQDMLDAAFPTGVFDVGEAIDAIVVGAGGNVITYSNITEANKPGPAPTSTEGRKSGDIHRNRNQNTYEIYAEWMLGTSGTWQPVNFGDSILRSLDVGKITGGSAAFVDFVSDHLTSNEAVVNELWAEVVRSRKITTDMLLVGSGENMIPDPSFSDDELLDRRLAAVYEPFLSATGGGAVPGAARRIRIQGASGGVVNAYLGTGEWGAAAAGGEFPVKAGGRYRFWVDVRRNGGAQWRWIVNVTHTDGSTDQMPIGQPWQDGGAGGVEHVWTVPDDVTHVTPLIQRHPTNQDGVLDIAVPTMMIDGASLIVDGTIDAKHINVTGELTAEIADIIELNVDRLVSTDATIDEGVINQLWTDVVRSRKITTDMLIVGSGENMIPWNPQAGHDPHVGWGPFEISTNNDADLGWIIRLMDNDASPVNTWQTAMQFRPDTPSRNGRAQSFDVAPGESFRLRAGIGRGGSYPSGVPFKRFYVVWRDQAGATIPPAWVGSNTATGPFDSTPEYLEEITAPAPEGAVTMEVFLQTDSPGAIFLYNASIKRAVDSSLVVDGGITAKQITITGDPDNPDETGLVANIASILHLTVDNLYVPGTATIETGIVEELWTQVVRSRKITTDMLIVGQGENLIIDPGFSDQGLRATRRSISSTNALEPGWTGAGAVPGAAFRFRMNYGNGALGNLYLGTGVAGWTEGEYPVTAGHQYRLRVHASRNNATPMNWRWVMAVTRTDGSTSQIAIGDPFKAANNDWNEYAWTVPDDITHVTPHLQRRANVGATDAVINFGSPSMVSMTSASLIVDGAITAKKITITGDENDPDEVGLVANMASILHLTAENFFVTGTATIEESIINELWTQVVRSQKITTDMLLVGRGINLLVDPGFLDDDLTQHRIASSSGNWSLATGGNLPNRVRSNASSSVQVFRFGLPEERYTPIESGNSYLIRWQARRGNGVARARPAIRYRNQDGSLTYTAGGQYTALTSGMNWHEFVWTAPDSAVAAEFEIQVEAGSTTWTNFTNPLVSVDGASLIVDGTILADHLDAASVKAAIGDFDLAIAGSYLLKGDGRFATAASGSRVEMSGNKFSAFKDPGSPWAVKETVTLDPDGLIIRTPFSGLSGGDVLFEAGASGVEMTGNLSTSRGSRGIDVKSTSEYMGAAAVEFRHQSFIEPAAIALDSGSDFTGSLTLWGPRANVTASAPAMLRLEQNTSTDMRIFGSADKVLFMGAAQVALEGGQFLARAVSNELRLDQNNNVWISGIGAGGTTTQPANTHTALDGRMRRTSSLSEHKLAQEDITEDQVSAVKSLRPITWIDRADAEAVADSMRLGDDTLASDAGPLVRQIGLIAEEVEATGSRLATYDGDGTLQGVAYERLAVALLPWLHELEDRITQLEGRTQ